MGERMNSLAIAAAAVLALATPAYAFAEGASPTRTSAVAAPIDVMAPRATDRVLGRADAKVTIVEYASFTCSHCADFTNDVLPVLKARYIDTGKARLIFRDLPTQPAQLSQLAALIGRCAAPERFFGMANGLMAGQKELFASGNAQNWLENAVTASGRSMQELEVCTSREEIQNAMRADVQHAVDVGVTGTPSVFINGQRVTHTLEGMTSAIDAQLR